MTGKACKAREAKDISGIPANFSRSLAVATDGIQHMESQSRDALGITPFPCFSGIMNYASTTTSGKCTSDGTAGSNSQQFSNPYCMILFTKTGPVLSTRILPMIIDA